MVELQILSRVITEGNYAFLENNYITEDYFKGGQYEEEFNFIINHYKKYGNVPDEGTFTAKFPDIELLSVKESDKYLVSALREEHLFSKLAPVVNKVSKIAKTDANAASEYLMQAIKDLTPNYELGGVNIIADANIRFNNYKNKLDNQDDWYFSSGFAELDAVMHGINRREELLVIFARTNQGKSWILEKMITYIWKQGFNVGYLSPEMSADSIGYRFDTLYKGFSNKDLVWGTTNVDVDEYKGYINDLKKHPNKFIVATPNDFDRQVTVSKLRNWVKQYNLEALAIDGITYLSDERGKRNDSKTISLTNISEDLKLLGMELGIPILLVMQANRTGVVDKDSDDTPELESMRDTDGVAFNATKILSIRQKDDGLLIKLPKNRDGKNGATFKYLWNINVGEFVYTESAESSTAEARRERRNKNIGKDVF